MAQTFTEDWYDSTADPEVAFPQAEQNDYALLTNHSGTAAPANTTCGKTWYKMSSNSSEIGLRIRNSSNNAWTKILEGTTAARIWQWRNDADPGWVIDSSISDVLISVKSSAAVGYGSTGGVSVGSWTLSGAQADYSSIVISGTLSSADDYYTFDLSTAASGKDLANRAHKHSVSLSQTSHLHTVSNPSSWRPTAAVGVIVYPDLT